MLLTCVAMSATCGAQERLSGDQFPTDNGDLVIHPVNHATLVMQWNGKTVYVDPVGGIKPFTDLPKPDLVLVTHIHGDHFDPKTLGAVVPAGEDRRRRPQVGRREDARGDSEHGKDPFQRGEDRGRGDRHRGRARLQHDPWEGEVPSQRARQRLRADRWRKRVYIAGDTEDTAEMRALKGIDIAFLPMNLPYTMSVEKAAEAIRAFKPKVVYPYHYRSHDGTKADFGQLKKLVGEDSGVEIRVREWYPSKK